MKQIKTILSLLIVVSLLASCSNSDKVVSSSFIQKRKYNKGYFVSTKGKKAKKADLIDNAEVTAQQQLATETAVVKAEAITSDVKNTESVAVADQSLTATTNNTFVPTTKSLSTTELATSKTITPAVAAKIEKLENKVQKKVERKLEKIEKQQVSSKSKKAGSGKSQLVALLLCIFVGGLGIHRFYLGYIGVGVAQLLTAGGCGIWSLIDLIRIITGSLGPKDGKYSKTL